MESENSGKHSNYYLFQAFFISLEVAIVILYGIYVEFSVFAAPYDPTLPLNTFMQTQFSLAYPIFQDISVMMFVGFGFLMTFLRTHSWSAVGFNFVLTVVVFQLYMLFAGFWYRAITGLLWHEKITLNLPNMVSAMYCCASVLISFGGVLGKLNLFQLLVMAVIESCVYSLNEAICFHKLHVEDVGGSITIHAYGAYLGLMVALIVSPKQTKGHPKNGANYNSNLFAMIGTLFLWMFWPSFNCFYGANPQEQLMAVINTLLSLTGSTCSVFITSSFYKRGKLNMEDVLNATLAGGVVIGSACNFIVDPFAALLVGYFAGIVSTIGFEKLSPWLQYKIGLFDTCGIHNLHAMPGALGGIFSAIFIAGLTEDSFGYPPEHRFHEGRSASEQGGFQMAALGVSMGFGIATGIIIGFLLKLRCFDGPSELFDDKIYWEMEESQLPHGYVPAITREFMTEGPETEREMKNLE